MCNCKICLMKKCALIISIIIWQDQKGDERIFSRFEMNKNLKI